MNKKTKRRTYERTNVRSNQRTNGAQSKTTLKYNSLTWLLMLQWYILVRKDTCEQKQHGTLLELQTTIPFNPLSPKSNSLYWRKKKLLCHLREFRDTSRQYNHRFRKAPFSKCFPFMRKRKAGVLKFLGGLKSVFEKAPFSWWISVDGRPNRRNKAAFPDSSGEAWKES